MCASRFSCACTNENRAFIEQNLFCEICSRSKSVWLILPFYCCFRFLFSEISLRTFCSVWNFQGCITVYLSKIKTSCSARAVLLCCCSQRQLWYLIITAFVCQQLFWNLFRLGKLCFPWQIFMLTYLSDFVNNFFWNLFKFLSSCCVVSALPQQRIWVYHPVPHLSTLFCIFFKQFCKSSKKAHNPGLFCHFGSYCLFSFSHNLQ